jgi:hypothetical protein
MMTDMVSTSVNRTEIGIHDPPTRGGRIFPGECTFVQEIFTASTEGIDAGGAIFSGSGFSGNAGGPGQGPGPGLALEWRGYGAILSGSGTTIEAHPGGGVAAHGAVPEQRQAVAAARIGGIDAMDNVIQKSIKQVKAQE